jgi:urocanate hydratase
VRPQLIGSGELAAAAAHVNATMNNPQALHEWCDARGIESDVLQEWFRQQSESLAEMLYAADPDAHMGTTTAVGLMIGFQIGVEVEKGRRDRELLET